METHYRTCENCKKEVLGRSDKKFCCDKCKSEYHNKHNPKKRAFRSFCKNEKPIKSGFKNLKEIIQTEQAEIRKEKLLKNKSEDIYIELKLRKNYELLSEINKIEGLLYN